MPTLLWSRDIASDLENAKSTFSSWDSCMSEAYCKWPVIVGIIIGSLVVLSLLWCLARCIFCGAECCCGCLSCCNGCCPSPRRRDQGYQQAPAQYPPYGQYQSPQPPMYNSGYGPMGYGVPQTATFHAPSNKGQSPYNEDALPAMPSWDNATTKHVEEEQDVEMEKLDYHPPSQQQALLHGEEDTGYYGNQAQDSLPNADLGTMHTGPHHEYGNYRQFVGSPTSTTANSAYPPTYQTRSPSSVYTESQSPLQYAPSVVPPSYRTAPPSVVSPVQASNNMGRRPVQGSWRDV